MAFYFRLALNDAYSTLLNYKEKKPFSIIGLCYTIKQQHLILHGITGHCPITGSQFSDIILSPLVIQGEKYEIKISIDQITKALISVPTTMKGLAFMTMFFQNLDSSSSVADDGQIKSECLGPKEEIKLDNTTLNYHKVRKIVDENSAKAINDLLFHDTHKTMDELRHLLVRDDVFIDRFKIDETFNRLSSTLNYKHLITETKGHVVDVTGLYETEKAKIFTHDVDLTLLSSTELEKLLLYLDEENNPTFAEKVIAEIFSRRKRI